MQLKALSFAVLLLIPLAGSASAAAGTTTVAVSMDAESYSALDTVVGGDAPTATITLLDGTGAPLSGVEVRVVFLRILPVVGYASNETVLATTNDSGVATVDAPQLSSLPGNYAVVAFAAGASSQDRYSVGA